MIILALETSCDETSVAILENKKVLSNITISQILEQQKTEGVERKLVGFEMIDRGIPRHDYPIADESGNVIGKVTSGTQSPTLNKAIGLGYVETAHAKAGTEIFVQIRDKAIKAGIVKIPFLAKK